LAILPFTTNVFSYSNIFTEIGENKCFFFHFFLDFVGYILLSASPIVFCDLTTFMVVSGVCYKNLYGVC